MELNFCVGTEAKKTVPSGICFLSMIKYFPLGHIDICSFACCFFFFLVEMSSLFLVPPVVFLVSASFLGKIVCPRLKATGI